MKAKLIIASPLQLINAIEAKEHFGVDTVDITFFSDGNIINEKQIALLIEKLKIEAEVSIIIKPKAPSLFKKMVFLKNLKKMKSNVHSYKYVIIGHFRSMYQATYANFYKGEKILVDDGTRTIDDISFLNKLGYKTISYKIKRLFYIFFYLKPYIVEKKHTLFSYYSKKIEVGSHIRVVHNDFSFIKEKRVKKDKLVEKKIAFVGQSLVDSKLVSLDYYIGLLRSIDNYYKSEYNGKITIEYYVHRNESDDVLKRINEMSNWRVKKNELPLELHLLLSPEFPSEIGLFFSSVSETLSIIFGSELKLRSFFIPSHEISYRKSEIGKLFETNRISEDIQLISNYS